MMVDCWRRLYFYWKSRRNWKSVAWHYTYEWHAHKMKGNLIHHYHVHFPFDTAFVRR
jgi:hypothetical protein